MTVKEIFKRDLESIRDKLQGGMSYAELAREIGTDPTIIGVYTREFLPEIYEERYIRRTYITDNLRNNILTLYEKGYKNTEISEKLETHKINVDRVIMEHVQAQEIGFDKRVEFEPESNVPKLPDIVYNGKRYKDRFYEFAGW